MEVPLYDMNIIQISSLMCLNFDRKHNKWGGGGVPVRKGFPTKTLVTAHGDRIHSGDYCLLLFGKNIHLKNFK